VYASSDVTDTLWARAGATIAHAATLAINQATRWRWLDRDSNAVLMTPHWRTPKS
jgi:hypothetical protein